MKNLLEYILIHIVQNPDQVVVEEIETEEGFLYTISVHPEDMGRIIGKGGNVIQSIRTLARVRAMKEGRRVRIEIKEEEKEEK